MSVTIAGAEDGETGDGGTGERRDGEIVEGANSSETGSETASERKDHAPSQPSTSDSQLPNAEELLRDARERLDGYRTLKAKMIEVIEFGPRRFRAEGIYLQGADRRLRLDLEVSLENNSGRLLQVCEGDILWTVYDVGETSRITRRDITQILAAAEEAGTPQTAIGRDLGLGGLPALLAAAQESMEFDPPVEATIEGRKFLVIQGGWNPQVLARFKQQAQSLPTPTETERPLPRHVPDFARIYFDAEMRFPYRIRYLKKPADPGGDPQPLLTLDFRDIVVNASIDPAEFRYSAPDGANVADLTNFYLQQLRGGAPNPPGPGTRANNSGGTR